MDLPYISHTEVKTIKMRSIWEYSEEQIQNSIVHTAILGHPGQGWSSCWTVPGESSSSKHHLNENKGAIKFQFITNYPQVRATQSSAAGNKLKTGGALNRWQLDSGMWFSEPEEGWWLLKQRAFGDDRHKCGINKTPCCKDPPLPIDTDAKVNNMRKGELGAFPWET